MPVGIQSEGNGLRVIPETSSKHSKRLMEIHRHITSGERRNGYLKESAQMFFWGLVCAGVGTWGVIEEQIWSFPITNLGWAITFAFVLLVGCLFMIGGWLLAKDCYEARESKVLPDDQEKISDPFVKLAVKLDDYREILNLRIRQWQTYDKFARTQGKSLPHLDVLHDLLLEKRKVLVQSIERVENILETREISKELAGKQSGLPELDLNDLSEGLRECAIEIEAHASTIAEMDVDDMFRDLNNLIDLDSIAADLGNDLPELKKQDFKKKAAMATQRQPQGG